MEKQLGKTQPAKAVATYEGDTTGNVLFFNDVGLFAQAVKETGAALDFAPLLSLGSNFLQANSSYVVLCVKLYDTTEPNTILFMDGQKVIVYTLTPPSAEALLPWKAKLFDKPFGKSTAIAFLVLRNCLSNYKTKLESLIGGIKEIEQHFEPEKHREFTVEVSLLLDRLEDLHEILIELEVTDLRQVATQHISFDYKVLIAEAGSLLDRCKRRIDLLRELARDHETRATVELNRRIERLNDVVKKLTAVTVILMIPTLIASHFGMNFAYMPELRVHWAYPAVIAAQVVLMAIGVVLFKRIGWL